MAVKKPLRRKRTRGRNFAGVVKAFRSNRWTGTSGLPVAVAFVALVGLLMLAYSASPPPAQTIEHTAARSEDRPAPEHAAAPATKPSPAAEAVRPEETEERQDGVTTGPMPTVVTLTGCLAGSDKEFRLKDTTGLNAPKSRSWKSGFLTKRSASITIVPDSSQLPLSKHVGARVTVSGTLIDREMRVHTLRRVSSSCNDDNDVRVTA
jgi:hypothetical protein